MGSIQYDSTEILNTTYVPRSVRHESAPERDIEGFVTTREDGEVLVTERYGTKRISVSGVLTGSSQADLESKIDAFKELFSRLEKNLDVDWNGSTRRYVATCERHEFDRDHFNVSFVPWRAVFIVLSGEGKDTSTTTARNQSVTVTNPAADSFTLSGSKPPKPVIKLTGSNWSTSEVKGVEYKNTDTGERIIFTKDAVWANNSIIEFDCLLKRVRNDIGQALAEGKFYGVFPKFKIGTNNIQITAGGIVNQTSPDQVVGDSGTSSLLNGTSDRFAQGFSVPYADDTFQGVTLMLEKTLAPGDITIRIETDADGEPSGSIADGGAATMTLAASGVTTKGYYTAYAAAPFTLEANVKYWIVVSAAGVDGSNFYDIFLFDDQLGTYGTQVYSKGVALLSTDAGSTWSDASEDNLCFRVLFGGKRGGGQSCTHNVVYTKTYL